MAAVEVDDDDYDGVVVAAFPPLHLSLPALHAYASQSADAANENVGVPSPHPFPDPLHLCPAPFHDAHTHLHDDGVALLDEYDGDDDEVHVKVPTMTHTAVVEGHSKKLEPTTAAVGTRHAHAKEAEGVHDTQHYQEVQVHKAVVAVAVVSVLVLVHQMVVGAPHGDENVDAEEHHAVNVHVHVQDGQPVTEVEGGVDRPSYPTHSSESGGSYVRVHVGVVDVDVLQS